MTRDELIAKIKKASTESDQDFREIISRVLDMDIMTEVEMAEFFDVARPTIKRWRTGASSPHSYIRGGMYDNLIDKLQQAT